MEDLATILLYIVGGALYLTFSIRKAKKNQPQRRPAPPMPPQRPDAAGQPAQTGEFSLPDLFPIPEPEPEAMPEPWSDLFPDRPDTAPGLPDNAPLPDLQPFAGAEAAAPGQSEPSPFLQQDLKSSSYAGGTVMPSDVLFSGLPADGQLTDTPAADTEKMSEEPSCSSSSDIMQDFDLRRAVLYSEILRPKFND